jgi:hypothetical protein
MFATFTVTMFAYVVICSSWSFKQSIYLAIKLKEKFNYFLRLKNFFVCKPWRCGVCIGQRNSLRDIRSCVRIPTE